jgi:DNA-binding NtrC family response regulator
MPGARVLIVEDDAPLASVFAQVAERHGYTAAVVDTVAGATAALESGPVDLLITDLHLPDGDGVGLIQRTRRSDPRIAMIAVTGFGSIELAVRAVREGAHDFLTKPVEPAALAVAMERALEARTLRSEVERLRRELAERAVGREIVGRSQALLDVIALTERVAGSDVTVLVSGPSGSGKELIARALHQASPRREGPFVPINAAAIPDTLLEAELFGYVKGAFTGARSDKRGLFQEAERGTLFLDEIGDLPLALPAKLLRVLQEREVRPVGATRAAPVDVRVVAATHHDLKAAAREGRFREDLYYRLAVVEIAVPPLVTRRDDILPLAEHFLARAAARTRRLIKGFSAAAAQMLTAYAWPGNVRELENAVERAAALARAEWISPDDLPPSLVQASPVDPFVQAADQLMTLADLEKSYVRHVLERFGGNKKRAADALGINRRTIQRWLGEPPDPDSSEGE